MGLVVPPALVNLTIYQGATFRYALIWTHNGSPVLFPAGTKARAHIRRKYDDTTPLLEMTTEGNATQGRILLDSSNGRIDLELPDERSSALAKKKVNGVWDLEIEWLNGDVCRLAMGQALIEPEVTHD